MRIVTFLILFLISHLKIIKAQENPILKEELAPSQSIQTKPFNDPFINILTHFHNKFKTPIPQYQHYSYNGKCSTLECTIIVPLTSLEILPYFEKEFEANQLPYSIYYLEAQSIYSFKGRIGNEDKTAILSPMQDKNVKGNHTMVRLSSETNNVAIQKQYIPLQERFSEFQYLPAEKVKYKEDHHGQTINAHIILKFKSGTEYALEEIDRWLLGYGWKKEKSISTIPVHTYTKYKATVQATAHMNKETFIFLQIEDLR